MKTKASLFPESYQEILSNHLHKRQARNAAYTLTAFARDLKLSKASLSLILSGQQGLSIKKSHLIAEALKLSRSEQSIFLNYVIREQARSLKLRQQAADWIEKEKSLSMKRLQEFSFRVNWRHIAIRELIHFKSFQPEPQWLALQLETTPQQAKKIWQECIQAGWIIEENSHWKASDYISLGTGQSNMMLRDIHYDVIQQAEKSLREVPMENRYVSFSMFAISPNQLSEAKELIKNFRQQLATVMHREDSDNKSEIFCFASQLFPVVGTLKK